jgi:hypothetical protein
MRRTGMAMLAAVLLAAPAMADHPAIGYWFVEVASLTNAVTGAGSLSKVDQSTLDEKAECRGYFTVNCNVSMHARTVQVRIKAEEEGGCLTYTMSLSWPHVKRSPVITHGQIMLRDAFAAKHGWEKDKHVLVVKRLNLKN